jgi:3-hydroxyisobutyrate dehydrogenase
MTALPSRIGFIGIGIMGESMVRRLLDQGRAVTVWNLEPERLDTVVPHGAVAAESPAAVAAASDIVLLCVLHTEAVANCVFGPQGIATLGQAAAGKLLVDTSTIDPAATREMAARLAREAGMAWLDAPLSGGPHAARSGKLTVMAGGDPADLARAEPVLRDIAGNVTLMGPVGAGQTTKIINQAIVGTGFVLMAESLALAQAAGIDAAALPTCLAGGFADSELLRRIYVQMLNRDFDPPASYARQLLKDLKAVKGFARSLGLELALVEEAAHRYDEFVEGGNAMRDSAAILDLYRPAP